MTFGRAQPAVVIDASVAVEVLAGNDAWADRWAEWLEADALLLAPPHFGIEVANALLRGLRLSEADSVASLGRLWSAGIEVAERGLPGLIGSVELAGRHDLTVYDAAYLDLALDVDAELATLDRLLQAAAVAEGIAVAGEGR